MVKKTLTYLRVNTTIHRQAPILKAPFCAIKAFFDTKIHRPNDQYSEFTVETFHLLPSKNFKINKFTISYLFSS